MEVVLSLPHVVFPSDKTGAFRVKVALTDGDLPMHLWLESKQSKAQWYAFPDKIMLIVQRECLVKDTQEHVPKGATYVLPSKVVATTLQNGLSALAKDEKPSEAGGSMVALKHLKSGHIELVLTLTAFGCLEITYSFDMMPMEIDKIDILEAKIRDLEESSCGKISRPVVLSLSLNFNVTPNCYITWTVVENPCAKCFELSQDPRSISVVESGLYYIQFDGYLTNWSNSSGVKMLMDNATITSAPVHNDGHGHKATITHLLIATKATVLMFQVYGSFNLKSGATLSIARLHEFCAA
ncbi:hypothetical protein LEN26_004927 [Aphanomyces euteiches]|nr:hypothetical protein AeMF1_011080 [Aphanomyces euteiches]KAH9146813.1 hypothetical protein LEN26_004927 [Aphanomyces euteiches]KAH9194981.1 hypothetical protein AeNC1_003054 [Aphanomyces euteiches]